MFVSFSKSAVAVRRVKRLKCSVWASGKLHSLSKAGFRDSVCWFVTLTYVGVRDWKANHMSKALLTYRHWCKSLSIPCKYTWVAELQSRGAVHYHLLCWLPVGVSMPFWDKLTRTTKGAYREAFWPHGMTNTQKCTSGVGYLMKYLSKLGELTVFPKGLRLYGIGGLDEQARMCRSWFNLPTWAKSEYGVGELLKKPCGFVVRATGEILAPAFAITQKCREYMDLQPTREIPEKWWSGVYSTYPKAY